MNHPWREIDVVELEPGMVFRRSFGWVVCLGRVPPDWDTDFVGTIYMDDSGTIRETFSSLGTNVLVLR